ncbi:methyltransferase domain-containing protein [Chaetomidium leptoderma]|uniref:Methyltransferase domain-containing protein n=1 Tax=Chaetomidium leptoderma TaxID=669021 RepID=A0AAN6VP16_9PEZI|nr:methyltransferase domain-containing protein [Chaetomidium leptoderma]
MLPTPSTSHVPYARVYEPAEDSFLLLDTLSSASETSFLASHFPHSPSSPTPLVLEIGPGSGVVLAFLTAHASTLFSRRDILTLGIDINRFACTATRETVATAVRDDTTTTTTTTSTTTGAGAGYFLGAAQGDLTNAIRPGTIDVLVFNPPYVPTDSLPSFPCSSTRSPATTTTTTTGEEGQEEEEEGGTTTTTFEQDSALLALSYAGGRDGMEITERVLAALPRVLSARGVAYVLLCAQNKPEEVKGRIEEKNNEKWRAETVGSSGKQAGWEKLQIVRIWRE